MITKEIYLMFRKQGENEALVGAYETRELMDHDLQLVTSLVPDDTAQFSGRGFLMAVGEGVEEPKKRTRVVYPAEFEKIWLTIPKQTRGSKQAALKRWKSPPEEAHCAADENF